MDISQTKGRSVSGHQSDKKPFSKWTSVRQKAVQYVDISQTKGCSVSGHPSGQRLFSMWTSVVWRLRVVADKRATFKLAVQADRALAPDSCKLQTLLDSFLLLPLTASSSSHPPSLFVFLLPSSSPTLPSLSSFLLIQLQLYKRLEFSAISCKSVKCKC